MKAPGRLHFLIIVIAKLEFMKKTSKFLTVHYAAAFAVYFAAFCMVRSFIAVYLNDRGFSYTQVGIITAVHMFCTAVIQPYFSAILKRLPNVSLKKFICLCCIPSILCSALTFALPSNIFLFIPIYILFGFFEIGLQSLMVSLGMEYVNAGIPINAGIGRGFGSVGYAAANIILGMLIVKFGSPISHILNIGLLILFCVLLLTLPEPRGAESDPTEDSHTQEQSDDLLSFLRGNAVFSLFVLSTIFIFFGHSVVNTYLPNVVGQFGLGADFAGLMTGLAAFLELIPMMFYANISKKVSAFSLLRFSAVFFFIKILTAALAKNGLGIAISESMQILAYAVFVMASIYFANQAVSPRNRVMAQGLLIGANETGFTIGGLVGGIVIDTSSIRTLLWMAVGVTVIGSFLMITAINKYTKSIGETGKN